MSTTYEYKNWAHKLASPEDTAQALEELPRKTPDQINFRLSRFQLQDRLEALAMHAPLNGPIAREMIDRRPWLGQLMCKRSSFEEAVGRAALQGAKQVLAEITTDQPYPPDANIKVRVLMACRVIQAFTRNIERPPQPLQQKLWQWTLQPRQRRPEETTQGELFRSHRLWKSFWGRFNKIITRPQLKSIFPLLNPRERVQALKHPKTTPEMCLTWLQEESLSNRARNTIGERFSPTEQRQLWIHLREHPTPTLLFKLLGQEHGPRFRSLFQQLAQLDANEALRVPRRWPQKARRHLNRKDFLPLMRVGDSYSRKRLMRFLGRLGDPAPRPEKPAQEETVTEGGG